MTNQFWRSVSVVASDLVPSVRIEARLSDSYKFVRPVKALSFARSDLLGLIRRAMPEVDAPR